MKNNTCVICGEQFEAREGKLYCSDACKQHAYKNRVEKGQADEATPVPAQTKKTNPVFYFKEFLQFKTIELNRKKNDFPIELFCFIRKNLTGVFNFEFFKSYVLDLEENGFFDNYDYEPSLIYKEYNKFYHNFHAGNIEISMD